MVTEELIYKMNRSMVALDDEGNPTVKHGEEAIYLPCLGKSCLNEFRKKYSWKKANNNILVRRIFGKTQNIVCPHCKQKLKVRCYKNGTVSIKVR